MTSQEFGELGGSSEIAEILGISKQGLAQLREHADFPPPIARLRSGPVWKIEQVKRWKDLHGLRSRGRPIRKQQVLGGRFAIQEALGSGGFATVYRAQDQLAIALDENSVVAVKILKPDAGDEETKRRFIRELRLLQEVKHPHVIPILGWGDDDGYGSPWYAMPLAQGNLADQLKLIAQRQDIHEIIDVIQQASLGLKCLHEEGIIHRDITPMNILWTQSGSWAISDLGLAREIERHTPSLTSTGVGFGTPGYMAPEAETGVKFVKTQADIYGLGKVLHSLLLGHHPSAQEPIPQSPFRPIIEKATAYYPGERYTSVDEFLAAIARINTTPQEVTNPIFYRLRERLLHGEREALNDLISLVLNIDKTHLAFRNDLSDLEPEKQVFITMARLTKDDIAYLWVQDKTSFREAFKRFTKHLTEKAYPFDLCDTLADFTQRVVNVVQDNVSLKAAVEALSEFGYAHNRWHVRSVLLTILQEINTSEEAIVALDALNTAWHDKLEWNLENDLFLVKSFHPVLRNGIQELLDKKNRQDTHAENSSINVSEDDFPLKNLSF